MPAATRAPGSTFFSTMTPGIGAVRLVSPTLIRAEAACAERSVQLAPARFDLTHRGFHIGRRRCVLLHRRIVVRAGHGLCSVQSLRALKVLICLSLVGFGAVKFRLRSIQGVPASRAAGPPQR